MDEFHAQNQTSCRDENPFYTQKRGAARRETLASSRAPLLAL
jgi:hypothetical protein